MEETRMVDSMVSLGSRLEMLADLHKKGLIEEAEFQEMRAGVIQQMKTAIIPAEEPNKPPQRSWEAKLAQPLSSTSYGDLHNKLVERFTIQEGNAARDERKQIQSMIREIADLQVISAGDTGDLMQIANIVYDESFFETGMNNEQITMKMYSAQIALSTMNDQMRIRPDASAPARAIAEIADQSSKKAVAEMEAASAQPPPIQPQLMVEKKQSIWKSIVQPDLKGAFTGCQAAVSLQPVALDFSAITLSAAAAIGAVIGAGIQSAAAFSSYKAQDNPG